VIQSTRIPWRARAIAWLLAWMITAPMFTAVAEQNYTVRRGDTLYGIARKHGITARNGTWKMAWLTIS
jgi:spore germination protein YaaH